MLFDAILYLYEHERKLEKQEIVWKPQVLI